VSADHERIWLQPRCDACRGEDRTWCQDNVWSEGCDPPDCSNAPTEYVRADLAAPPAGFVILPAEMTEAQAIRSMAGHALPDRVRDVNPEMFARLVELRRATWRQMVAVMRESGDE
jgi:hypothetical protein